MVTLLNHDKCYSWLIIWLKLNKEKIRCNSLMLINY